MGGDIPQLRFLLEDCIEYELKGELKQRGLSAKGEYVLEKGKKSELVTRLETYVLLQDDPNLSLNVVAGTTSKKRGFGGLLEETGSFESALYGTLRFTFAQVQRTKDAEALGLPSIKTGSHK